MSKIKINDDPKEKWVLFKDLNVGSFFTDRYCEQHFKISPIMSIILGTTQHTYWDISDHIAGTVRERDVEITFL